MRLSSFSRLISFGSVISWTAAWHVRHSCFCDGSRRQPPTSNDKKNKRPGETPKTGDKEQEQEPLPQDIVGKPQDAEKVTITTQIVNVDTVVYHKKSGADYYRA